MRSKAELETRLTNALMRLGAARREKLSTADFAVFADGLRDYPIAVVERVCEDVGRRAPDEFQPRFPPLHVLRESCALAVRVSREKQLNPPRLEEQFPAPSPERSQEFLAKIRAIAQRKVMR